MNAIHSELAGTEKMAHNAIQNFLIYHKFAKSQESPEAALKRVVGVLMGVVPPDVFRWCVDEASRETTSDTWELL